MFSKISADLQKAMKERDTLRLDTLRMMKSKILLINARGDLPEAEIIKILSKYAKSLVEAIEETKKVNRPEDVKKLEAELKIVEEYLPKQKSAEEIKQIVEAVIKELGADSMKQMGQVMKAISANNPGIDGKIVSELVKQALS